MKLCTLCGQEGHLPKDCPMRGELLCENSLLTSYMEYEMMYWKFSSLNNLI